MSEIGSNLLRLQDRIAATCSRVDRTTSSVTLMAVSKNQPPERITEAAALGLTVFGENRIQEARAKIHLCPSHLQWQFIGHLQSNKARDAVSLFHTVQGIDSATLASEIQKHAEKQSRRMRVLLEVNVAGEASKFGWNPERLLSEISTLQILDRLEIQGLMTIAPYCADPERVRPFFRRLRELRDRCAEHLDRPLPILSMGMSGDMEIAIEEGSTLVRIGTALFGNRPPIVLSE